MDPFSLLRLYVAIADQGSLSAASRALSLSPSTVTLGLQRLEHRVGARLVTRTTRTLSFTPEGERFLADCRRILADLNDTLDNVSEHGPLQGEIRVTATNDFGRTHLAPLIDGFMQAHPGVRVSLMLTDAVVDLADSGYDLALRMGQLPDSRLVARLLLTGTRHICATPAYWQQHGRPSHPRELTRYNCMVLARPGAPQTQWPFQENGETFQVRVHGDRATNDGGALRHWALAGAGVVLKSSFDIDADLAAGRLEAVLSDFAVPDTNLYAVYVAGRPLARRLTAFIDYVALQLGQQNSAAT